jgi:DNA-binding MarR family transcriptional regulator
MNLKSPEDAGAAGPARRRLSAAIKQSLRALRLQLSLLNLRIGAQLELKEVDIDCLDLVARYGPLSPSALARRAGLHPATMTGVLDRLEQGGWVARERDPSDRRAVVVRTRHERGAELMRLYAGMNTSMDEICAGYDDAELAVIADFLGRTTNAGRTATDELTRASAPPTAS